MRSEAPGTAAAPQQVSLPPTVGAWTRASAVRRIEPATIFEYMDGAGELYLAYRFDHLDVVEYTSSDRGTILVELYWMRSSDDAYGLLSGDWGGERVRLSETAAPDARALYGAGLLRLWADTLYARVLAEREDADSKGAVLELGRRIAAGRSLPAPPRLAALVPPAIGERFAVRGDSICFLRSHLVLNSAYFLSQQNILNLDRTVEAVTARYDRSDPDGTRRRARLLLVRYPDAAAARAALGRFREAYLPETLAGPKGAASAVVRIEDGWTGYALAGPCLAVVFEAPDRETAAAFVAAGANALERLETPHG